MSTENLARELSELDAQRAKLETELAAAHQAVKSFDVTQGDVDSAARMLADTRARVEIMEGRVQFLVTRRREIQIRLLRARLDDSNARVTAAQEANVIAMNTAKVALIEILGNDDAALVANCVDRSLVVKASMDKFHGAVAERGAIEQELRELGARAKG